MQPRKNTKQEEDVWLDAYGMPVPKETIAPPGIVPSPWGCPLPRLMLPVPGPEPRVGFAAAVTSNRSSESRNGKGEKKAKGSTKPTGISKKKKKELQNLLYG